MLEHLVSSLRWTTLATALAAITLTGCGASDGGSTDGATATPSSSTATSPDTEPATETEPATDESTPLDGTWTTPALAPADFRRVLAAHGLGAHADTFLSDFGESIDLTLEVGGGFWTLSSSIDGGATSVTDRASFEVDGTRVIVLPNSGGENTFRWKVAGDDLVLDLVSTTEPPYAGVPAETYQRGLYTASAFRRMS